MEYRKLISCGKSSFVVTLPKSWINHHRLKKGDMIYLNENLQDLVLQPKPSETAEKEKEIVINIDGKELKRVERETISAYIQNYRTITLLGEEVKDKAKSIEAFIQKLLALEIMEQDSKKIVAKDFLNLKDISVDQIVRKMDVITRSMLTDCKKMFQDNTYESINYRDQDVNKFRFLIYRIVWCGMENPSVVLKKLNLQQLDLFNYWWVSFSIEQIADCVKRIARYMKDIKLSDKAKKDYLKILYGMENMYGEILKAYYTNNLEVAHHLAQERIDLIELCDKFYDQNRHVDFVGYLIYSSKSFIANANTIGRIIYQRLPG